MGSRAASSASIRWITVSWAIRRIQKPTVWSGPNQVGTDSAGSWARNCARSSP